VSDEHAAIFALLRGGPPPLPADVIEQEGTALSLLTDQHGLLTADVLAAAGEELARLEAHGIQVLTVLDPDYPLNLRAVHDRPALIFVRGALELRDRRALAVIGSRAATPAALDRAREITEHLVACNFTVCSGLAAGIDTAAHAAALASGGRTIAVLGTGVNRSYPKANASLQRRIAGEGAVISRFLPDAPPARANFPVRNALMSGLALGTVVVEASPKSGARTQIRMALAHGRPVFLDATLIAQTWAREMATRAAAHVFSSPSEIVAVIDSLANAGPLVG
jgi:DNA processing protein